MSESLTFGGDLTPRCSDFSICTQALGESSIFFFTLLIGGFSSDEIIMRMNYLLILVASQVSLSAMTLSFDLEGLSGSDQSEVVLSDSGFTVTIAAEDNEPFRVGNTEGGGRATFANRSLLSLTGSSFIVTFSQPVDFFSVDFGDFGADVDTGLLDVFFLGSYVTVDNESYFTSSSLSDGDIGNLESFVPEISSARLRTSGDNSVLWDNFTVTLSVPEPSSALIVASSGLLLFCRRSRMR